MRADPVAGEREDEQPGAVADRRRARAGRRRTPVDRWLASGRGRTGGRARRMPAQKRGHDVAALVLERHRRHRHEDVVGQQGDDRVEVGRLVGADELGHERLLGRRVRRREPVRVGRRRRRCRPARARLSALVTDSTVESSMSATSLRVEAEDVAQDEHGELARRQQLQRGHERQRDRLGLLVAGLGAERHADRVVEEGVGIGLEPRRPRRAGSARAVRLRGRPTPWPGVGAADAQRVEAPVGGDPVEPRAHRRAALEPVEALPGGQQRVLQRVLGVLERAEHPVAVHLQLPAVRLGQRAERLAVAGPRPGDQLGRHQLHVRVTSLRRIASSRVHLVQTPAGARTGRSRRAQFPRRRGVDIGGSRRHRRQENRNGKDRDQHERLARRSGPGPRRRRGLRARRLVRPSSGARTSKSGARSRSTRRWAPTALLLGRRSDEWFADAVAVPDRRVGGPVEQPAQVRRVVDPRRAPTGATRRS